MWSCTRCARAHGLLSTLLRLPGTQQDIMCTGLRRSRQPHPEKFVLSLVLVSTSLITRV